MKALKDEALDQTIHFTIAFVVAFIAANSSAGGFLIGLALGLVREITEGRNILSSGSLRDLAFWTLGGTLGGVTF